MNSYDIIIIGAGIMGLALARALKQRKPELSILILEKESEIAQHASGRNSGVLHAGFYYTADSLKARFTVAGSNALREFCKTRSIPINECGKIVVATNAAEVEGLYELERRGKRNGSDVSIITTVEAEKIEPNIRTHEKALFSPKTASTDPALVCEAIARELRSAGVDIKLGTQFLRAEDNCIITSSGKLKYNILVNAAGLYADKIAQQFGFSRDYTIIPFKGLYLKYEKNKSDVKTNIYPVPNLKNPFLGVHFTKTSNGAIKIGPTAIPAFWREHYNGLSRFSLQEFSQISFEEAKLFFANSFGFRSLAFEELQKYSRKYFISQATKLVKEIDINGFGEYTRPGIRAQLLNLKTRQLVQDFVVEGDAQSVHILNAVSPGFTCSFPFAEYVIERYISL